MYNSWVGLLNQVQKRVRRWDWRFTY